MIKMARRGRGACAVASAFHGWLAYKDRASGSFLSFLPPSCLCWTAVHPGARILAAPLPTSSSPLEVDIRKTRTNRKDGRVPYARLGSAILAADP